MSQLPRWQTSSFWFSTSILKVTTPPPMRRIGFLARTVARKRTVSPIQNRAPKLPLQLHEGLNCALHKAHAHRQSTGDTQHQQPMGHALAEHLLPAVVRVRVDPVPVSGQRGEVDNIHFRNRAAHAFAAVTERKLLKIQPHWGLHRTRTHNLAPFLFVTSAVTIY